MRFFRPNLMSLAVALGCLASAPSAHAIDLLSGFGADGVYGERAMQPNDDGSSSLLNLPFAINFFGQTYSSFFVNNNGNITFKRALSTFTPNAFPISNQPMIAPWWGDVDTRGTHLNADTTTGYLGTNNVYVGSPNADTVVITWDKVGYYSSQTNKINDFQLVIRNRADTGAGNFDFDFRYKQLEWTTGNASGGSNGLGGTPAQAGYDDGLQTNYLTLPGSRSADVLDLVSTSNVDVTTPGLWTFAVRNGQTPGFSPSNPLLPVFVDGAFVFDFNVVLNQRVWIDPDVAVGYTYDLASADLLQDFDTIEIDTVVGDGLYDVFTWDGTQWVLAADDLAAGTVFTFADGVRRVMVNGIELDAALDPTNPQAFVTGFTFGRIGSVQVTQRPLTEFVPTPVPEPETYALVLAGLAVAWGARRRQNKAA